MNVPLRRYPVRLGTPSRPLAAMMADNRAATALEFGIIAPMLIVLILATLQMSLVFFAQQTLESTSEIASRNLLTGTAQSANMSKAQFKTKVCGALPAFLNCASLIVDVQTVDSFQNVQAGLPVLTYDSDNILTTVGEYVPGDAGDIVVIRVMYPFPVLPGPFGFDLSNMPGNKRMLLATSVFRAEPYRQ